VKTPSRTKSIVAAIAVGALALAAPAVGSAAEPPSSSSGDGRTQLAQARSDGQATDTSTSLRRDGGQATQFVAELSAPANIPGDGDAFDWGDAAIGAGAALFAATLLMAGSAMLGGRRRDGKPTGAVSQRA
jgi:hypothetical protein